jgi:hypothetical protein
VVTRSAPLLLIGALSAAFAPDARAASDLDAARQAYGELNYEGCKDAAQAALEAPGTREERVDAYRLLGLCEAALDDTDAARTAFSHMVAIDPDAKLPEGLSPRFTSSYLEARGQWTEPPLTLEIESQKVEQDTRVVRLQVRDLAGLAARVVWEDEDGERGPPLRVAERMEIEVPAEFNARLLLLDETDGVLAELPVGPEPAQPPPPPPSPGDEEAEEDAGGVPWVMVGAAGAGVLVAGAVVGGVAILLTQPGSVTLTSDVAFGN